MDLEKERGITIKAQTAAAHLQGAGRPDLPPEPDRHARPRRLFLRSQPLALRLRRCAAGGRRLAGVEAQTVANCYTAIDLGVEVIPVLNKIDLPAADPDRVAEEIEDIVGLDASDAVRASAKTGIGILEILEVVVKQVPPPRGNEDAPLKALIIDSWFDNYVGVVMLVRVVDGVLKPKDKIRFMASGAQHLTEHVGVFTPKSVDRPQLSAGEVGFVIAGIKELKAAQVGDTITLLDRPASEPLPGFKKVQSQVFAGLYPVESHDFEALRDALTKLQLNDAALQFEPEVSQALGFGFRCGFLGLLHMDIVQERLEREYDMDLITTAPTVVYEVLMKDGTLINVENPFKLPELSKIEEIREPIITATIFVPEEFVGNVITLCNQKRGMQVNMQYHGRQVMLVYDLPMNEVVMDFFDKLKSTSRGYASLDYEFKNTAPVTWSSSTSWSTMKSRCAVPDRAPRHQRVSRTRTGFQNARTHPAPDVRRGGAGGDRRKHHRTRERQGAAQERARQVLRWRHHAQEETAGKTESRQAPHEAGRQRRNPAGSLSCDPSGLGQVITMNFALILFIALAVTGGIWLLDVLLFSRYREKDAREPMLVEYAKSFFPVILIVFGLRSFLVEPFKIPSGSMMPTLLIGDFILVNKYTYGIRLPVINKKVVELNNPSAAMSWFSASGRSRPRLHQTRGRRSRRRRRIPQQATQHQRQAGAYRQYRHLQLCRQRPQLRHRHGVR